MKVSSVTKRPQLQEWTDSAAPSMTRALHALLIPVLLGLVACGDRQPAEVAAAINLWLTTTGHV